MQRGAGACTSGFSPLSSTSTEPLWSTTVPNEYVNPGMDVVLENHRNRVRSLRWLWGHSLQGNFWRSVHQQHIPKSKKRSQKKELCFQTTANRSGVRKRTASFNTTPS